MTDRDLFIMPSVIDRYPNLKPDSRRAWRTWLRRHHDNASGVWIVYTKRSAGRQPLSYEAAVEEALCFGWIDSLTRSIDARSYRQLFTPRKVRSPWSALNKRRAAALIKSGRMTGAGLAAIRLAKRTGTWTALAKVERREVPRDLATALRANDRARAGFDQWSASVKRGSLWWLHSAKRPETRLKRLREIVNAAARGRKPLPYRQAR